MAMVGNSTSKNHVAVLSLSRDVKTDLEEIQQNFVEFKTLSENLSRSVIRSQGKLESRMEHVERTQEKLEDIILSTKDNLNRLANNMYPMNLKYAIGGGGGGKKNIGVGESSNQMDYDLAEKILSSLRLGGVK